MGFGFPSRRALNECIPSSFPPSSLSLLRAEQIQGRNCEWVEQVIDSVIFGCIVGCPWWMGLLASAFAVLPNHDMTKAVMASDDKLKVSSTL